GRVVDEHVASAEPLDQPGDLAHVAVAVGNVAAGEDRRDRGVGQPARERLAFALEHVEVGDGRALAHEALDDAFADPRRSTADDDLATGEARVDGSICKRLQNPLAQRLTPRASRLAVADPFRLEAPPASARRSRSGPSV